MSLQLVRFAFFVVKILPHTAHFILRCVIFLTVEFCGRLQFFADHADQQAGFQHSGLRSKAQYPAFDFVQAAEAE